MQFLSRSKLQLQNRTRVNQMRFLLRFVAAISQGFRTCLKLDVILARQKLHRVAATKIACVNRPLNMKEVSLNEHVKEVAALGNYNSLGSISLNFPAQTLSFAMTDIFSFFLSL